jgi:hypothetical protein
MRMQKLAGIDHTRRVSDERGQPLPVRARQKSNVSKIHTRAPVRDSDLKRYAAMKSSGKDQRNQNIADAFYHGGHSQTAGVRRIHLNG